MSDTWDAEDRAIARALDAAPESETEGADERLVDEYREVLGTLQPDGATPPAELEDRVLAAALARRPAARPAPASAADGASAVSTLERGRARRRKRVRVAVLAAATVAAAVVVGVIVHDDAGQSSVASGRLSLTTVRQAEVDALVRAPGARTGDFGAGLGRVVIGRDGNAAVYDLRGSDVLDIGLVSSGGTTRLGPVPPTGGVIAFVVDHPDRVVTVTLLRNGAEFARAQLSSR